MNFEINLMFLIKPLFLHAQKVTIKTLISREQELLRRNKTFFVIFNGLSMKQIKQFFALFASR